MTISQVTTKKMSRKGGRKEGRKVKRERNKRGGAQGKVVLTALILSGNLSAVGATSVGKCRRIAYLRRIVQRA